MLLVVGDAVAAKARGNAPGLAFRRAEQREILIFRMVVGEVLERLRIHRVESALRHEFLDVFGVADDRVECAFRNLREILQHLLAADVVLELDLDLVRLFELADHRLLIVARPGQNLERGCCL